MVVVCGRVLQVGLACGACCLLRTVGIALHLPEEGRRRRCWQADGHAAVRLRLHLIHQRLWGKCFATTAAAAPSRSQGTAQER